MENVHCMSSRSIHINYNHDQVQAQLCTQRTWEQCLSTLCTEVVRRRAVPRKGLQVAFWRLGRALWVADDQVPPRARDASRVLAHSTALDTCGST